MEIRSDYREQVRLLLEVLPFVAAENCFALKGGTAINLFEWDLPRLSVDIDLTYLPIEDRDTSLRSIAEALGRIKTNVETKLAPAKVTLVTQNDGLEAKLHIQRYKSQIKVEVNPTLRGNLLPVRRMAVSAKVQELFEVFVETTVISHGELFGGKICAALDRQHPRDLFDVKLLLDATPELSADIKTGMIAGLVSHKRPIAELIKPALKDKRTQFRDHFEGMPFVDFTYDDHLATFDKLASAVITALDDNDKAFLLSFTRGEPDWSLFPVAAIEALPGPQWKLENIRRFQAENPDRFQTSVEIIEALL